jgi:hypothetical protein
MKQIEWPITIQATTYRHTPAIDITHLSPGDKRQVWEAIKLQRPELARMLASIPPIEVDGVPTNFFEAMEKRFGAVLTIDLDQLPTSVHHLYKR